MFPTSPDFIPDWMDSDLPMLAAALISSLDALGRKMVKANIISVNRKSYVLMVIQIMFVNNCKPSNFFAHRIVIINKRETLGEQWLLGPMVFV